MLSPRDSRSRDCRRLDGLWRFRFDAGGEGRRRLLVAAGPAGCAGDGRPGQLQRPGDRGGRARARGVPDGRGTPENALLPQLLQLRGAAPLGLALLHTAELRSRLAVAAASDPATSAGQVTYHLDVAGNRELDPGRPVCFANVATTPPEAGVVTDLFDLICVNRYDGWYADTCDLESGCVLMSPVSRPLIAP